MKKLLLIAVIVIIVGCTQRTLETSADRANTDTETIEERDSALRDWPFPGANGNWIPSRDGLENCDTIVDGYPYNHV